MLQCCILEFEGSWEKFIPLVEFSYNNSYQSSIKMEMKLCMEGNESYADLKGKDVEFQVGRKVFLKVLPWKKVFHFSQKRKLNPRFIGPHKVIKRIGLVAYHLALPEKLEQIHNVFHVSMLRWDRSDPSHISLVKVLWQCHGAVEASWESDDTMKMQYQNLFSGKIFKDENFFKGVITRSY
ncbi:reverse transcriptase [Gossypium australe]|uniref:Reverse transcriptase n=1 Tax=Gossypium australe TaxID=47621 RepID=A0A5B6VWM7_9ROSI|nr:reverse transcriptase [Gossypium australe]